MAAPAKAEIELTKTSLPHVFLCDVDDSGLLKEILVMKKFKDGSIYYVLIDTLHAIDKGRIKRVVSSQHADKYECWELMSQTRLSNGLNFLDYAHQMVRVKRVKGSRAIQGTLENMPNYGTDKLVGEGFVNPAEALLDKGTKQFQNVPSR